MKLISFMGTPPNLEGKKFLMKDTDDKNNDKKYKFHQTKIYKEYSSKSNKIDEIYILYTTDSDSKKKEIEERIDMLKNEISAGDIIQVIQLEEVSSVKIKSKLIKEVISKEERDDIILDITSGLRHVSMNTLFAVYFLEKEEKVSVKSVYYADYHFPDNNNNRYIMDLIDNYRMLEIGEALELFDNNLEIRNLEMNFFNDYKELNEFFKTAREFNEMLQLCDFENSIRCICKIKKECNNILQNDEDDRYIMIQPVINRILKTFDEISENNNDIDNYKSFIELLIKKGKYQIAITFIDQLFRIILADLLKRDYRELYEEFENTYNEKAVYKSSQWLKSLLVDNKNNKNKKNNNEKLNQLRIEVNNSQYIENVKCRMDSRKNDILKFYNQIRNNINHGQKIDIKNDEESFEDTLFKSLNAICETDEIIKEQSLLNKEQSLLNKEQRLLNIVIVSLFHDIGKFYQFGKDKFASEYEATESFFREKLSGLGLIVDDDIKEVIEAADDIASYIDSKNGYKKSDGDYKKNCKLKSVFRDIDFGGKKEERYFPIKKYSDFNLDDLSDKKNVEFPNIEEFVKNFVKEIDDAIKKYEYVNTKLVDKLYAILYDYTTLFSAFSDENNQEISLFDHLKLTAAVASCICISNNHSYKMLEFDISGIQNFIFKITEGEQNKKDIAKSLRGRSFMISTITNLVAHSIINEFGLTQANIIFNTGGGATILLPFTNEEEYQSKISKVVKKIQSALYEKFKTDVTFVYSDIKLDDGEDLKEFKAEKAIELKDNLDEQKVHKFQDIIEDSSDYEGFFFKPKTENGSTCTLCGNYTDDIHNGVCTMCDTIIKISDFLVKKERLYLVYDFSNKFSSKNEYIEISIDDNVKAYLISDVRDDMDYDYIESLNRVDIGNSRNIANLVPFCEDSESKRIMSFEEISNMISGYGDNKIGVLKMDVDNLGSIFAFGINDNRSISKFLTLSRLMEKFFGSLLVDICIGVSKTFHKKGELFSDGNMFYINYAGGDDLAIIGPAAAILQLSNEINDKFNQYTGNDKITISGGIHIQKPKEPIRYGMLSAEQQLEMSKDLDNKNGITLLDISVPMDKFRYVIKEVSKLKSMIDGKKISRTLIHNILILLNLSLKNMLSSDGDLSSLYTNYPKILYIISKNELEDDAKSKIIQLLSEYIVSSDEDVIRGNLRALVLIMKLVIMQTKEGELKQYE